MLDLPVVCPEEGIVVVATPGMVESLLRAIREEDAHSEGAVRRCRWWRDMHYI